MNDWEWESFDNIINAAFQVTHAGPLHTPIRSFFIKRDDNHELIFETLATENAQTNAINHPIGTVRINTDTITLKSSSGIEVVANGVQSLQVTTVSDRDKGLRELRERASLDSVEAVIECAGEAKYTMEWLANVDYHFFSWPDLTDDETEIIQTRTLCKNKGGPVIKSSKKSVGHSSNCVKIRIANMDIYLGSSSSTLTNKDIKPGFILYTDIVPEDIREKIRKCLSFSLGMYLVYFGYTTFNANWDLTSFKAIRAYSLDKKVFDFPPMPPSPLNSQDNYIDPVSLSHLVNALYSKYDSLEIGRLSWMYWHAVCAPVHVAAVQFGAAIEALQNIYSKSHDKTKLLDKPNWDILKPAMQSLCDAIKGLGVEDEIKQILRSKLGSLNNPPQKVAAEMLLKTLQLNLGNQEKTAWERRNDAAHGNEIKGGDYIRLIRDVKLLRLRFHRMFLCMTNASDFYYDYYTPALTWYYSRRGLCDPVPDDVAAATTTTP